MSPISFIIPFHHRAPPPTPTLAIGLSFASHGSTNSRQLHGDKRLTAEARSSFGCRPRCFVPSKHALSHKIFHSNLHSTSTMHPEEPLTLVRAVASGVTSWFQPCWRQPLRDPRTSTIAHIMDLSFAVLLYQPRRSAGFFLALLLRIILRAAEPSALPTAITVPRVAGS